MGYVRSVGLVAVLVAAALALGAALGPAEAQLCSKPKKGCVVKNDIKKNAVDSSRVKNNSLKGADFKDGTLTGANVKNNSLSGADVQDKSLSGSDFQDGGINEADLAPDAESDALGDLNCSTDQIARFINGAWACATGGASHAFISSNVVAGNAGVAAMDQECQDNATAARLPAGTYRAWLSTSTSHAKDLLPPGPFYLTNGDLLAVSKADLLDQSILELINLRANPTQTTNAATGVWTGTKSDGTASTDTCNDWISDAAEGTRGNRNSQSATWTDNGKSLCDQSFLLYCIQVQ